MQVKQILKKIPPIYALNARLKAAGTISSYHALNEYYRKEAQKRGIVYSEEDVPNLVKQRLEQRGVEVVPVPKGEFRIFYVGASVDQDFGGIVQGLSKLGDVLFFECEFGKYGQIPTVTTQNRAKKSGQRLVYQVKKALESGPIHAVIGQMWARTMDSSSLQTVREMGIPVVNISMDDRHAFRGQRVNSNWTGVIGLIHSIDLACTTAPECCLWYAVENCPAIYLPEASDPELFQPSSAPKLYDVSFVGANYGIRAKILKEIERRGISVCCYGSGWTNGKIDVKDMPELFARSRIVLGVGTIGHCTDLFSLKMRDFDGPMSGSLYLTHDNPDLCDLFDVGKEIVIYRTPEECADKVLYYLDHRDERKAIARAGRDRAVKEHTWEKRFETVLQLISGVV